MSVTNIHFNTHDSIRADARKQLEFFELQQIPVVQLRCQYVASERAINLFKLIVLSVYCEILSLIRIFTPRNMATADIHHHICEVCDFHAMTARILLLKQNLSPNIYCCEINLSTLHMFLRLCLFRYIKSFLGGQQSFHQKNIPKYTQT